MGIRRRDIASATPSPLPPRSPPCLVPARAQSKNESTWDLIKRTGQVRMGVFEYSPYFMRDKASGEWVGAMVEMGKDIANELKVKFVPVEVGGFGEAVLSLQAGKVDMNFALQATPLRATAIDFAGPIYWIEWVTVNNPNFNGKVWADYNKDDVKVAVMTGTSDELLLRKMAPKATRVEFKSSGRDRARRLVGPRRRLHHHRAELAWSPRPRTRASATSSIPTPRVALPGYIGLRLEDDARWQKFLNRWAEWNILLGHNETRMRRRCKTLGIDEIPSTVSFSPN